jgi:threonine dehydrogenase-like Zn-dependent dehydrogenase
MHRLMRLVAACRIDLTTLFTHVFPLEEIRQAYEVLGSRRENVFKVAIRVS